MVEKLWIYATLDLKRKSDAMVRVGWREAREHFLVRYSIITGLLVDHGIITPDQANDLFQGQRRCVVSGYFVLDELMFVWMNIPYAVYPDRKARHLVSPDSPVAISLLVQAKPIDEFNKEMEQAYLEQMAEEDAYFKQLEVEQIYLDREMEQASFLDQEELSSSACATERCGHEEGHVLKLS